MYFCDGECQMVAATIKQFNEYAASLSINEIVAHMHHTAYSELHEGKPNNSYVATGGFVLTRYNHPKGGIGIKASLSAFLFRDCVNL
jgi:hypothetical protein